MTRDEALKMARNAFKSYVMADFQSMMGVCEKPNPADYYLSGSQRQPGNTMNVYGHHFHVDEVAPQTMPVNSGF